MNTAQSLPSFPPSANEVLADKISRLAAHIHAATYRFLVMIREFDEREAWAEMGARSCAHWLNWRCGLNMHTAREKVRVAHALVDLAKIGGAFERGELSYSKVRAVTRIANADNEDTLLNIALSGTAAQLERVVRCEVRHERESEVIEKTSAAFAHREFGWHSEDDGSVVFFGRLPAEMAEHVIKAIESAVDGAMEAPAADVSLEQPVSPDSEGDIERDPAEPSSSSRAAGLNSVPAEPSLSSIDVAGVASGSQPRLRANRFKRISRLKAAPTTGYRNYSSFHTVPAEPSDSSSCEADMTRVAADSQTRGSLSRPSIKAQRADALVALCQQNCSGYEVTLRVPAGPSLHATSLENTGTIPIEAARRICCDAAIVPVSEDEQGNVLDIGRRTRKIPPAIRRALELRDKGCCRFPGCTNTRFLKGHHIEHWAQGGKTCLDNLVLLCWHHHHLVHEGGYLCTAIRRTSGKGVTIVFGTPGGVIIPEAFRLPAADDELENQHTHLGIDEDTCSARDANQSLDVNVVIDALDWFKKH